METHKVPSVSQAISFDVRAGKQQGFLTHGTGAFKTVAVIGHAAQSAVFDAAAGAGRFQSSIGHVVVNEVFHLEFPCCFPVDAARAADDFVQSLCADRRLGHDVDVFFLGHVGAARV